MLRRMLLIAVLLCVPATASAQGIGLGVAGRAGSLGFGGEVAVGLTSFLGVRGGVGALPFTYDGNFEEVRYHVDSATPLMNVGVDLYPGFYDLRIGGGVLFVSNPTTFDARFIGGTVRIDGQDYTDAEVGELTGELNHGRAAPYVVLGLGRQTNRGLGIFLDLGAAFLERQKFTYDVTGPLRDDPDFQQALGAEAGRLEDDFNRYVKVYPILSAGIRYGFR